MLQVLVIDEKRYLINTESKASEKLCNDLISNSPNDATIDFVEPVKGLDYRTL